MCYIQIHVLRGMLYSDYTDLLMGFQYKKFNDQEDLLKDHWTFLNLLQGLS